jgi:solute carrier family 35 (UDP-sugar transporter), member A1/2/3
MKHTINIRCISCDWRRNILRDRLWTVISLMILSSNQIICFNTTTNYVRTSTKLPALSERQTQLLSSLARPYDKHLQSNHYSNVFVATSRMHRDYVPRLSIGRTSTSLSISAPNAETAVAVANGILSKVDLGLVYGLLLALQFAIQPILIKKFVPREKIVGTTYVFSESAVQFVMATTYLLMSNKSIFNFSTSSLSSIMHFVKSDRIQNFLWKSFQLAGIPAGLVVMQNFCKLLGYHNLQPITFNAINQTKTIFAAIFCYMLFNQKQSPLQILSLGVLLVSAFVMESIIPLPSFFKKARLAPVLVAASNPLHKGSPRPVRASIPPTRAPKFGRIIKKNNVRQALPLVPSMQSSIGLIAVLSASAISGFGGALTQRALQSVGTIEFTAQLSFFSMLYLIASAGTGMMLSTSDREKIRHRGFFAGWTPYTLIPVCTSAIGGILVGMVTKHAGVVRKGFALMLGLFMSGLFQNILAASPSKGIARSSTEIQSVTSEQWVGGLLAAISIWMHSRFV